MAGEMHAFLAAHRKRAMLTQEELAERSGISVRTIRQLEGNRVGRPRSDTLRRLADALSLDEPERLALLGPAGTAPARPGAPVPAPRNGLPMDVAHFTGRTDALAHLGALVESAATPSGAMPIVAVVAGPGVGKTALAVHWAHRVRHRFPGGVLFVNLEGFSPGGPITSLHALTRLLRGLGVDPERLPMDEEAAADLYRSLLCDRQVLVVLDNARDAEQVRPLLPTGPGCMTVVTSRERLTGLVATHGARRLALDVLSPAEAVALFGRIVGDERVRAEGGAAAELVRLCGHLPLAVRIAAANIHERPDHPLAAHVDRLGSGDRLSQLAVDGDAGAAVGVAFDASYEALDPSARLVFRRASAAPGIDVTPEAAAALADVDADLAARLLDRLAGANIVDEHSAGRYVYHDLARLYADQRAGVEDTREDRARAFERLLDRYARRVDAAARLLYPDRLRIPVPDAGRAPSSDAGFPTAAAALSWLDAERPHLVAAVQRGAREGPHETTWLLTDALRGYFWVRADPVDWLATAHAGLAAAEAGGSALGQAAARLSIADAYGRHDVPRQAEEHYEAALELTRSAGWSDGEAAASGNLGALLWDQGRLEEAATRLQDALQVGRRHGVPARLAPSLSNLGLLHYAMGRLGEAAECLTEALALDAAFGTPLSAAATEVNLGMTHHAMGRLAEARELLTRGLAALRDADDLGSQSGALQVLAGVHLDLGDDAEALAHAETALALAHDVDHRRLRAQALNTLGAIHRRRHRHAIALSCHQEALAQARATGARKQEVAALVGIADSRSGLGHGDDAVPTGREALALARDLGFRLLEGDAARVLAGVLVAAGRTQDGVEQARAAVLLHRQTGQRIGRARALVVLGQAVAPDDPADAAASWREALDLFTRCGAAERQHVCGLLGAAADPVG